MSTPSEVREWLRRNALSDEECAAIQERVSKYHNLIDSQPPPRDSDGEDCWNLVMKDMEGRRVMGIHKYGMPVRALNGRDALIDAYEEALDLCVYIRQEIEKRKVLSRPLPLPLPLPTPLAPPSAGCPGGSQEGQPPNLHPQPPLDAPVDP